MLKHYKTVQFWAQHLELVVTSNEVSDLVDVSENVKFLSFTPYSLFITGIEC
jgi:hypothetical protein